MPKLSSLMWMSSRWQQLLVFLSVLMIIAHLILAKMGYRPNLGIRIEDIPLYLIIFGGGIPLIGQILIKLKNKELGADVLAALAIITAVLLDQNLAATLIILMLASGQSLEAFALGKASSVLRALADRMPKHAHVQDGEHIRNTDLSHVKVGDHIILFPHEVCPVDGVVVEGQGHMDESYLTGEPYHVSKAPGVVVLSGAINGDSLLIIKAVKKPSDSRYSKIVEVMTESQQKRPHLRRLGDQLGAIFIPVSLVCAGFAWAITGDALRFLSVLVIATPCPLLIGIPITIISAISLAARKGIIIKDPVALERLPTCRTAIFDKTGTLTYGKPKLTRTYTAPNFKEDEVIQYAISLERYSKHPLAQSLIKAGKKMKILMKEAHDISEEPGQGLTGTIGRRKIHLTNRKGLIMKSPQSANLLPPLNPGLECVLLVDGEYAATFQFQDEPRREGVSFISHLGGAHKFKHIMLVSGDKESEVKHLADLLGIQETLSSQTPEQKLEVVRREVLKAPTLFVGDGINDAPALTLATVGVAFGKESQITMEAAGIVLMENTLTKIEELIHISYKMRVIALQSAVGGILLSLIGMGFAAFGYITPVVGAILQEGIDVLAIFNALRLALAGEVKIDMKA